jgi:hypothetical protein
MSKRKSNRSSTADRSIMFMRSKGTGIYTVISLLDVRFLLPTVLHFALCSYPSRNGIRSGPKSFLLIEADV